MKNGLWRKPEFPVAVCLSATCVMYVVRILVEVAVKDVQLTTVYYLFFFGRKLMPILVFALFLLAIRLGISKAKKVSEVFTISCLLSAVGTLPLLVYNCLDGNSFAVLFSFRWWTYLALFTWIGSMLIAYLLFYGKTRCIITSFCFAWITISLAGVLYELPLYPRMQIDHFHLSHPLFVTSGYVSFLFLGCLLVWFKWKPTRLFWGLLGLFLFYSFIYFAFSNVALVGLFARIPAILLMLTIPFNLGYRGGEPV